MQNMNEDKLNAWLTPTTFDTSIDGRLTFLLLQYFLLPKWMMKQRDITGWTLSIIVHYLLNN